MNLDDFNFDTEVITPRAPLPSRNGRSDLKRSVRKGEDEADQLEAPVRILGLNIVGYKRIQAVQFELNETGCTILDGACMQGKSSCLEAVQCLIGGGRFIPEVPVNRDHPQALISGDIQDASGRVYRLKRTIESDRATKLTIVRADGTEVPRAQEFLDAMKGVLWYDPLAFSRQKPAEQSETVRRLLGLDLSALDREYAQIEAARLLVGRDRDRAKGHYESLPFHDGAPTEELTSTELSGQMEEAATQNAEIAEKRAKLQQGQLHLAGLNRELDNSRKRCDDIANEIAKLQERLGAETANAQTITNKIEEFCPKLARFEQGVAGLQEVDIRELAARLTDLERTNAKVRDNKLREQAHAEWQAYDQEYDAMSETLRGIKAEKRAQIAAAPMPLEGLAFDEEGLNLLYDGLPFSQASGGESLVVSVTMSALMAGSLKLCLIDEAEKLDHKLLALVQRTSRNLGAQLLLSRTSMEDDPEHIVIEDGAVLSEDVRAARRAQKSAVAA